MRRLFCLILFVCSAISASAATPVLCGYIFPQGAPILPGQIDAHAMTRINYAFATISGGRVVLANANDAANLSQLSALHKQKPSLQILLSIGGWGGSGGFSDAALTAGSRAAFVESAVTLLKQNSLDGLDVDWEYPGLVGAGNKFRADDKRNYTLLLRDLRAGLDRVAGTTHRHLILTIAGGSSTEFLEHTQMAEVARAVDAVNLMAYDYYEPGSEKTTGHHAALFTSPQDPEKQSANDTVKEFEAAGVPPSKLILGVPFYGHAWSGVSGKDHGLFQPGQPAPQRDVPYQAIATQMLGHGFTRYWDQTSKAPWLYNDAQHIFVSYEDAESLAAKCAYVQSNHLAGIMFWVYGNDNGELLKTVQQGLGLNAPAGSKPGH